MRKPNGMVFGAFAAGLVVGWVSLYRQGTPTVEAAGASAASRGELIAISADAANGSHVVYLIDPHEKVLSAYQFDPKKSRMKLSAVRHYAADHQLSEFNNEPPFVADIERLVVRPRQQAAPR